MSTFNGGDSLPDGVVANFQDIIEALRRGGIVVQGDPRSPAPQCQPQMQPGNGVVADILIEQLSADVRELKAQVKEIIDLLGDLVKRGARAQQQRARPPAEYECVAEVPAERFPPYERRGAGRY